MNARVANACTGADGLEAARAMARAAEEAAGLPPRTALVLSTGVIGVPLPVEKVAAGLRQGAAPPPARRRPQPPPPAFPPRPPPRALPGGLPNPPRAMTLRRAPPRSRV